MQSLRKMSLPLIVLAAAFAITATAVASPLRVVGGSHSSGDFAVTAANGSKKNAHALYIRGYGRGLSGMGVVACNRGIASIGSKSTSFSHMASGRLYRLRMPFAGDCDVTASLSGSGPIRLQILG
jgi:hypothetical protein